MDIKRLWPSAVVFLAGWAVGLFIFGWWLTPVQYSGATPQDLSRDAQETLIETTSDLYAANGDKATVQRNLGWSGAHAITCEMAANSTTKAQQLENTALAINNQSCADAATAPPVIEEAGKSLGTIMFLFLLLLLIVGAIVILSRRRKGLTDEGSGDSSPDTVFGTTPDSGPVSGDDEDDFRAVPIAKFQTTYNHGHETFDDSFSIEMADGTFLGECGVTTAESIGTDLPKNVTAIEVWLFDKNDIRTITKVVMSDHAFFDEALKAKLSPKGEPTLAREGEVVVLETAALIINIEITGLTYGTDPEFPPESYFEQARFELSAWSKEGGDAPDVESEVDEILNY